MTHRYEMAVLMRVRFAFTFCPGNVASFAMSSRELVIDLVNKLPEDALLAGTARKIELFFGI
jgi:hypothetical protein